MEAHRIRRIPVVDKGKLVGIISRDALDRAGPSQITTFSIHEVAYLLSKITVREVMKRDLVTISPDATVEEGVALAQARKVGALLVVEDGKLVGIATTNDFFYKILNPTLGIGQPGSRVVIHDCCGIADLAKIIQAIQKLGIEIVSLYTLKVPDTERSDCTLHLGTTDVDRVVAELRHMGFAADRVAR
jgi:acetoin utilization protein AcuB